MSVGNVKFTLGLDTSNASQQLAQFWQKVQSSGQGAGSATAPLESALGKLIEQARRVGATWDASAQKFRDSSGAERSIQQIQVRVAELEANLGKAAQAMGTMKEALSSGFQGALQGIPQGIGQALGMQLLAPFRALQEVVAGSSRKFIDLDQSLMQTLAAAGESSDRFGELSQTVIELASASAFSAKEIAGVTTELARAGFTIEDVKKALPGIQAAAAASGEGLAETTQNMIIALGGFQLGADQAGRVADVMTVAANAAAQSTSDVGEAFKYTAPVAKSLGLSLEDTAAATILLANAGIKGSQAGTALRSGLGRLAQAAAAGTSEFAELSRGTGRMGEVAERLALGLVDVQGNLLPLPELVKRLKAGTDGLASTEKSLVMKILFGEEAGSSWISLLNNSVATIDKAFVATNNASGTAAKVAAQNLSGISGALKLLEGAIGGFQASLGTVISAALLPLVRGATEIVTAWNQLPTPLKAAATVLIGLAGTAAIATVAVLAFNATMKTELVLGMVAGLKALVAQFSLAAVAAQFATAVAAAERSVVAFNVVMTAQLAIGPALRAGWAAITAGVQGLFAAVSAQNLAAGWNAFVLGANNAAVGVRAFLAAAAPMLATAAAIAVVAAVWTSYQAITAKGEATAQRTNKNIEDLQQDMAKLGVAIGGSSSAWDQSVKRVGFFDTALDKVRASVGLTTAAQASLNVQSEKTAETYLQTIAATDGAIAAYRKAITAAGEDSAALEKAGQMRQKVRQTLEGQLALYQNEAAALQSLKVSKGQLSEEESRLLAVLEASIKGIKGQEVMLNAAAKGHEATAAAADKMAQSEKALTAALEEQKNQFKNATDAMEQSFANMKTQKEDALKATQAPLISQVESLTAEITRTKEAAEAQQAAMQAAGDAGKSAYHEAASAAKELEDAQLDSLQAAKDYANTYSQSNIENTRTRSAGQPQSLDLQSSEYTRSNTRSTEQYNTESRQNDKLAQAEQARFNDSIRAEQSSASYVQASYQSELRNIQSLSQAEEKSLNSSIKLLQDQGQIIQRNSDAQVKALMANTPAEERLANLDRARLQRSALIGGEEGLRAQAQLERAAKQLQIDQVKAVAEAQTAALQAQEAQRREAYEVRRIQLEERRSAMESAAMAQQAASQRRLVRLQEEAAAAAAKRDKDKAAADDRRQLELTLSDDRQKKNDAEKLKQKEIDNKRISEFEKSRKDEQQNFNDQIEAQRISNAIAQKNRSDAEQKREQELEKSKKEGKSSTTDKIKDLEAQIDKFKKAMADNEKRYKGELESAERQLTERKVQLQTQYRNALGETNNYIVKAGSVAWKNYADAAIGQLQRVRREMQNLSSERGGGGRAIGGPVQQGTSYTVNEYGQEAFLSRAGQLSLITSPMFGTWQPPTAGTVIPAGLTSSMKASGAFNPPQASAASASADGGHMGRLLATLRGPDSVGRITNNVTIQSQEPVTDASRLLVEMSRLRLRRR